MSNLDNLIRLIDEAIQADDEKPPSRETYAGSYEFTDGNPPTYMGRYDAESGVIAPYLGDL